MDDDEYVRYFKNVPLIHSQQDYILYTLIYTEYFYKHFYHKPKYFE